ncbi:AAA domain-containing protein [Actinoplanes philippinensis]|uniref:AAA domain-containing protein n=1 Tax=Actinoplanes philippinensis TaxID=35752 RepID=UPI0033D01323
MALTESTVLAVLAELAPAGADRILDVTHGSQPLVWLTDPERATRREGDRLAAVDALHREERILHRGWGFLAGRADVDGKPRKVRVPLLSQPVRLERSLTGYRVTVAGDTEVTPLIADRELAASLENAPGLGLPGWLDVIGARAWLTAAAEATGLDFDAITEPGRRLPGDRLVLVAGAALYVARDVFGAAPRDSLRSWAGRDLSGTALAAVYGTAAASPEPDASQDPVVSPLPLSEAQARVVARARTAPVTVVSGPPGNGKSHTVVAAALEVVHRGGSVLIATQSPHAAEVLAALLARYPGPAPVLFGDTTSRDDLATWLTAGADEGVDSRQLRADRQAVDKTHDMVRTTRTELCGILRAEQAAATLPAFEPSLAGLTTDVPGAFDDAVDLPTASRLLGRPPTAAPLPRPTPDAPPAHGGPQHTPSVPGAVLPHGEPAGPGGWWVRWRAGSAVRRGRRMVRARPGVPLDRVWEAVAAASAQRAAARLAVTGGGDLARWWDALHEAEAALRAAAGTAMRHASRSAKRWDADGRRAASALATALRAGRGKRREMLARMDAAPLVRALPLWIGTVTDVEDLLPAAPGMFDLVVIDEASHVDQIRAAPVLARARRALIVGDPRQLRFVSFVSDAGVSEVLNRHGADDRLDVRRVSTFDLAAAAAPATWLTEHFRSVPHLIGFSARRFYGGRIATMTRTPAADVTDAIDVVPVAGARVADGVNGAEVAAAITEVERLAAAGFRSIGVITPFRAQAEALESALVAAFPVDRIEELGLRVGTVHSFQGSEADAVVVSLGLVDGDAAGRRRFVTDPQLFNVMITRARHRLVLLTSLTAAAPSPIASESAASDPATSPATPGRAASGLTAPRAASAPGAAPEATTSGPTAPHAAAPSAASEATPTAPRAAASDPTAPPAAGSDPAAPRAIATRAAAGDLVSEYLAYADAPDRSLPDDVAPTGWAARLATELERLEVPVRPGYAVGSWRLDLCAGPADSAIGVLCGVHPDGPEAHLARQSALHRAGWRLVDAFPSRWGGDPRRAALEIAAMVTPTTAA